MGDDSGSPRAGGAPAKGMKKKAKKKTLQQHSSSGDPDKDYRLCQLLEKELTLKKAKYEEEEEPEEVREELTRKLEDLVHRCLSLGGHYIKEGNLDAAQKFLEKAEALSVEDSTFVSFFSTTVTRMKMLSQSFQGRGNVSKAKDQLEDALEFHQKAMAIEEELKLMAPPSREGKRRVSRDTNGEQPPSGSRLLKKGRRGSDRPADLSPDDEDAAEVSKLADEHPDSPLIAVSHSRTDSSLGQRKRKQINIDLIEGSGTSFLLPETSGRPDELAEPTDANSKSFWKGRKASGGEPAPESPAIRIMGNRGRAGSEAGGSGNSLRKTKSFDIDRPATPPKEGEGQPRSSFKSSFRKPPLSNIVDPESAEEASPRKPSKKIKEKPIAEAAVNSDDSPPSRKVPKKGSKIVGKAARNTSDSDAIPVPLPRKNTVTKKRVVEAPRVDPEQVAAATKIQALVRGHQVRKRAREDSKPGKAPGKTANAGKKAKEKELQLNDQELAKLRRSLATKLAGLTKSIEKGKSEEAIRLWADCRQALTADDVAGYYTIAVNKGWLPIVEFIVKKDGLDVNTKMVGDPNDVNGLHIAAAHGNTQLGFLLSDLGIDIDAVDAEGNQPIHEACRHTDPSLALMLIARDCQIINNNNAGWWPLALASKAMNVDVVNALIEKGVIADMDDKPDDAALIQACRYADTETALDIIEKRSANFDACDEYKNTPMHYASRNQMFEVVQQLVQDGAYLNPVNLCGNVPLHFAAETSLNIVRLLMIQKVDLTILDKQLNSPLHYACLANQSEIALLFIHHGVDIHKANKSGNTALHYAVTNDMAVVVYTLINKGAAVSVRDEADNTPLHFATSAGLVNIANILLLHKPDLNGRNSLHLTPLLYAASAGLEQLALKLLDMGADTKCVDEEQNSVLHYALANHLDQLFERVFADKSVNVSNANSARLSLMHYACSNNKLDIVKRLFARGVDIDLVDLAGNSPLHYACLNDQPLIAEFLIASGANIHVRNSEDKTPLDYAVIHVPVD